MTSAATSTGILAASILGPAVRYLRMLSNCVAAAVLATAYVLALVVELNPALPLHPSRLIPLVATVGLFYGFHLTVIFYVLLVLRQLLARELFSPAWISVDVLAWLTAISASAGALLMWRNVAASSLVLDPATASTIVRSGYALAAAAACCFIVAVLHRGRPAARAAWVSMFLLIAAASVATPMALRGRGTPPPLEARPIDAPLTASEAERSARVVVIAIDGGSLDFITSATAEGRLPNFGRLLDAGAVRHLATLHPTSAEAVWAAVATGKLPQKNGVRSASNYQIAGSDESIELLPGFCFARGLVRFGFLLEQPHSSSTFRTRTLWTILSTHGFSVAVVGWPLTQPAPIVRGYLVSDTFHRAAAMPSGLDDLLLVVSGYGMEPLGLGKRLLERVIGDPELSGTHENAPDGFLMAYGAAVARGRLQARASVVDVVPTILYFLGLPTGRDMDGYVRTDLFQPSFTEDRPIAFIPTYDR